MFNQGKWYDTLGSAWHADCAEDENHKYHEYDGSSNVRSVSVTDARIVVVRSITTPTSIAGEIDVAGTAMPHGSGPRSIILAPGCREMNDQYCGLAIRQSAVANIFNGVLYIATSLNRTTLWGWHHDHLFVLLAV